MNTNQLSLLELQLKLIHAKDFTPHKVAYYEALIKDFVKLHPVA